MAGLLSLAGCLVPVAPLAGLPQRLPKVPVTLKSVAGEPLKVGTFFHLVGKPGQSVESDLYFGEVVRFVTVALSSRGLSEAPRANRTDIIVEIAYTMTTSRATGARPSGEPLYEKHLTLTAREPARANADSGTPSKVLWTIHLTATDESNDLRKYLAMFVAASIDHIGVESYGEKTVYMGENDLGIEYVRTGEVKKKK